MWTPLTLPSPEHITTLPDAYTMYHRILEAMLCVVIVSYKETKSVTVEVHRSVFLLENDVELQSTVKLPLHIVLRVRDTYIFCTADTT